MKIVSPYKRSVNRSLNYLSITSHNKDLISIFKGNTLLHEAARNNIKHNFEQMISNENINM